MLIHMTRCFFILGKSAHTSLCSPAKHNTSFSCFFLKTIVDCCGYTLSLSLSTTFGILFFEVLLWNTLQFCAQLTVTTSSCYYQFPCFLYNKTFSRPPEKKSKRYPAVYRRTHRQTERDTYPPCGDRGGCNNGFASSIHMIPEMYIAFPLPYPSSPASWTLLLPLSVQDSHNISLNDRYHHSLSSLDNNETEIYLSICLFICLNQLYLQKYKKCTSPKGCCQRRTDSWIIWLFPNVSLRLI